MSVGTATEYTGYTTYGAAAGKAAKADTGAKANIWDGTGEVVVVADRGRARAWTDSAEISPLARYLAAGNGLGGVNTSRTAGQEKFTSVESREEEGARLDAYLADLRTKYGEAEAISRFNDFMRSEGYEIAENVTDSTKPRATNKLIGGKLNNAGGFIGGSISWLTGKPAVIRGTMKLHAAGENNTASTKSPSRPTISAHRSDRYATESFTTSSTISGGMVDGKMEYNQGTWAQYNAGTNSEFADTMEFWKNRNVQALSEQSGVDIAQYVEDMSLHWGKAFAAESVSTELGGIMNTVLAQAGLTLEAGQNVNLRLGGNGLYVNTDFGDDETKSRLQSAMNAAVKARPGILSAFRAESARTAQYDVSGLEGTYSSGLQSNHFTQQRIFTMSGSQPSVVVMGSGLDHMQTGYTYIKKVADSFDVNADMVDVRGNSYTTDTDPEEYARMKSLINTVAEQRR